MKEGFSDSWLNSTKVELGIRLKGGVTVGGGTDRYSRSLLTSSSSVFTGQP